MNYFYLKRHCFLIMGKTGAAIYDLYKEEIYSISRFLGEVIQYCENEKLSLNEVFRKLEISNNIQIKEIYNSLNEIKEYELGEFFNKRVVIEKIKPLLSKKMLLKLKQLPPLSKIWLKLNNNCNINCVHCIEQDGSIARCGCNIKHKIGYEESDLKLTDWKKVIYESSLISCKEIHIIGGEPLLDRTKLFSILEYIRFKHNKNTTIVLQSNGLMMTESDISFLKANNVTLKFVLYSYKNKIHDLITQQKGSFEKIMTLLKLISTKKLKIVIDIEILKINQYDIQNTISFLKEYGIKQINCVPVLSNNPKIFPTLYLSNLNRSLENLSGVSKEQFFRNIEGHPCWNYSLSIMNNGDISPCIMDYSHIIGNIKNDNLIELLKHSAFQDYWELSKDKIDGCKDCEFRYSCFDCRMREIIDKDALFSRTRYCSIF